MKHFQWPRPPLVLGFILGKVIERYMFISIQRYGFDWMLRPVVIVMFALALAGLLRSFLGDVRAHGGVRRMLAGFGAPRFGAGNLLPAALICVVVAMLLAVVDWGIEARIIPMIVGAGAMLFGALTLANDVFRKPAAACGRRRRRRSPARIGAARNRRAKDSHGYRIAHQPSADRRDSIARGFVLRLDGGLPGVDGDDRTDRDGAGLYRRLYAIGGARALVADAVDRSRHDIVHLRPVRPSCWQSHGRKPCSARCCRRRRRSPACSPGRVAGVLPA